MTIEDDNPELEFYGPIRPLSWELRSSKRTHNTVEDDDCESPSSFVWPEDPDERTVIPFLLSLNEYVVLATCIDVGRDIAYPFTSERVTWLWLRNFRCEVSMPCCDDLQAQITGLETLVLQQNVQQREINAAAARAALDQIYIDCSFEYTCIQADGPTENWNGVDGSHDDALCKAVTAFVYMFAAAKVNELRIAEVGAFSSALLLPLLIPGLNFFYLVGVGIAIALGYSLVGVTLETAIAALTDTTALNMVVCHIIERLTDNPLHGSTFATAASEYDFEAGSHAAIVSDFLIPTMDENELTVFKMIGDAQTAILGEQPPSIECVNCGQFDPHTLHIVNHEANPYPGTITFIGSAGTEEYWDVVTAQLPNTYWYMSIQDADGKTFTIVNVELIAGEFGEWSIVTPTGTVTPDTLEEAFGLDVIQPDLYIAPGPQGHVLLTLQELLPTWETITSGELPTGTITDQDATSVSVSSGFDTGTDRIWLRKTDLTPFEVDTITEGGGAITTYQWFDDTFTEHLTPIAHGDIVMEIYYESTSSAFTLDITIVAP